MSLTQLLKVARTKMSQNPLFLFGTVHVKIIYLSLYKNRRSPSANILQAFIFIFVTYSSNKLVAIC